ncbi:hypothetical protein THAOC_10578 [Thalassiosira oceanica]|uniref:Uncharacterized protein n=1 Tax=Thalassiosira oceanica TaxID=159749 RepID=K0T4H5_THAOC|nr:hypothetical protein THAOC_10578 [Thalassiosira oceanica]|eukprot:EJK68261.1 hypothetical protein THAOC_10578 [Thalassiosira oceanica]
MDVGTLTDRLSPNIHRSTAIASIFRFAYFCLLQIIRFSIAWYHKHYCAKAYIQTVQGNISQLGLTPPQVKKAFLAADLQAKTGHHTDDTFKRMPVTGVSGKIVCGAVVGPVRGPMGGRAAGRIFVCLLFGLGLSPAEVEHPPLLLGPWSTSANIGHGPRFRLAFAALDFLLHGFGILSIKTKAFVGNGGKNSLMGYWRQTSSQKLAQVKKTAPVCS